MVWISTTLWTQELGTEGQGTGTEGQRDRVRGSEGEGQKQRDRDRRTKYGLPMSVERPTECNMALA